MTNRIQTLRSSVAGNVPVAGSRQPGELWLNFADNQLGYIDASKNAQKFLAVRFFSALASYAAGDMVSYSGVLYAANAAIPPGAFNVSQWTLIGGAGVGYLPLTGGNLSGNLTLTAGNLGVSAGTISASGSGTFGSISTTGSGTFGSISTAGTAATGALTVTGNLSATGTGTFGGAVTSNNGAVISKGATGGFFAYDEGSPSGDTTKYFGLYRNGNLGGLTMQEAGGPVATFATNGASTFSAGMTVHGSLTTSGSPTSGAFLYDRGNSGGTTSQCVGLYRDANTGTLYMDPAGSVLNIGTNGNGTWTHSFLISGSLTVSAPSALTGAVSINSAANWPLQVTSNAGVYPALLTQCAGQHQYVCGAWPDSSFYIFDNSTGKTVLMSDTVNNVQLANNNGSQIMSGGTGFWDTAGKMVMSPGGSGAGAGGAISCYGAVALSTNLKSRVDVTNAYLMYSMYGGGAVGWVTTDGGTTYYSGACDGRLKQNVRSLASEVDVGGIIDRLNPVAFEWAPRSFTTPDQIELSEGVTIDENSPPDLLEKAKRVTPGKEIRFDGHTGYGFVAQELYEIVPHLVQPPIEPETGRTRAEGVGDIWGADITHLVPYLVAELQALRKRVAQLESA